MVSHWIMLSKNWLQKVLFVCLNMSTFKVEITKSHLLTLAYDIANWTCVLSYCCTLSSKTLIAVQHRFVSSQLSICGRAVDALSCSCLYGYWKLYVTLAICCGAEQLCPSTFRGKFVLDLCLFGGWFFSPFIDSFWKACLIVSGG
jgi:hypothetical protein